MVDNYQQVREELLLFSLAKGPILVPPSTGCRPTKPHAFESDSCGLPAVPGAASTWLLDKIFSTFIRNLSRQASFGHYAAQVAHKQ